MDFQNLDLNLLRIFDIIMSELNLTRAAERLAMTQPAVSNALKRLRLAMGDDLVTRTAFGVKPTARAQQLWPTVRGALAELESTIAPENFDIRTSHITFRIAINDVGASLWMPYLIPTIEDQARDINVRVVPVASRDPSAMLTRGEIDLAVGYFSKVPLNGPGRASPIRHERLAVLSDTVCVMREGHPLAKGDMSVDDYFNASHLTFEHSRETIDEALAHIGRQRRVQLVLNGFFTASQVLAQSDLVATMPAYIVPLMKLDTQLTTCHLPIDLPQFPVDLLWHERDSHNGALSWLRENVRQMFRDKLPALTMKAP